MNVTSRKDRVRLIEKLKPLYSEKTGFLHCCPHHRPAERTDEISISLNFLYLLLLFRTKDRENIEQAIKKLDQLLHFQSKFEDSFGNFPVYLHEYPNCLRYFEVMDSLFSLYWIYKEFSSVLPSSLKERLYQSMLDGLACIDKLDKGREYSYLLSVQRASLLYAVGLLLKKPSWEGKGRSALLEQVKRGPQECWGSPRALSKILIALELSSELTEEWSLFWSYLNQTWIESMSIYNGPALFEYYEKDSQEMTLYHLYMEKVSGRETKKNYSVLTLLEEELLHRTRAYQSVSREKINQLQNFSFESHANKDFCVNFFNQDLSYWEKTGGYYPFKLALANQESADTLVMQMGSPTQIKQMDHNKWEITIQPKEEIDVSFFYNLSSKAEALINGKRATAFKLDQVFEVNFRSHTLRFAFPNAEKQIWGQVMLANRRTQILDQNNQTYDTRIYFRQIADVQKPFIIHLELNSMP